MESLHDGSYDGYNLDRLGVRHTLSVIKGIDEDKVKNAITFAYNHGAEDVKLVKVSGSNGWQYELDVLAPKYDGQLIRDQLFEKGYAKEVAEVDSREEQTRKEKLTYFI